MVDKKLKRQWILVIAGISVLALGACTDSIGNVPPDLQNLNETRPVGNARDLEVHLRYDVGTLNVRGASGGDLFSVDLDYDARRSNPRFDFAENGDRAVMNLEMDHRVGLGGGKRGNNLMLRLNDAIPLDLDLTAGVTDSYMDMTDLEIKRFRLRGGVGRTEVAFDHAVDTPLNLFEVESGVGNLTIRGLGNAHVERLRVDGGVGSTTLDFTGTLKNGNIDSEVNVGVGTVKLVLPRQADVTIDAEGSFLSNLNAPGFEKHDHNYTHGGSDPDSMKIFIRVRSGVGGVTVELI